MKKTVLACALSFFLSPLFSQDAGELSRILQEETADFIDFSYMIASQTGMDCTPFEAYAYCDRLGSFPFGKSADKPISVKDVSHFLMLNYGLKGGILWTYFRNSRYAWKELKAAGFWDAGTDPDDKLSGRDMVRTVSRFFTVYPDALPRNPAAEEAASGRKDALLAMPEAAK